MPRNYQREQREGNEARGNDGESSVEGMEERSRRRMEEGGGGRERVTDTSSSRVVLSVECAAHMVKLRPRRAVLLPFRSVSRFDLSPALLFTFPTLN